MDNNFNQQAPQQPVYQQAPQQQMYQQAPQQPMYQAVPKKPSKINVLELLAIIFAGVAALMAILGTTFTCVCGASKSFKKVYLWTTSVTHKLSPAFIVSIFAALFAVAAIVCAILAVKKKDAPVKAGKMSYISMVVAVFAFLYAVLPVITICGYNCSLNKANKEYNKKAYGSGNIEDYLDDDYDDYLEDAYDYLDDLY